MALAWVWRAISARSPGQAHTPTRFSIEKLKHGVLLYGTKGATLLNGNAYTIYDSKTNR
jgi:hypothetical protein